MRSIAFGSGTTVDHGTDSKTIRLVSAGSSMEGLCGAAALVLAILALAGILPAVMAEIATIAAGGALLFEGGAVASRFRALERQIAADKAGEVELAGGTTMEIVGGLAAIVLGILALVGFFPEMFMAISAIALGAALLLGSGATSRLDSLSLYQGEWSQTASYVAHESILAASTIQALAGMAAIALGILALCHIDMATLDMVAMLTIGGALMLGGSAVVGKIASLFAR